MKKREIKWLNLGIQLRKLRESGNYSRVKFARMIGLTADTLKNYELGRTELPADVIKRVCEQFPVTPNYFYMEETANEGCYVQLLELYGRATEDEKKKIISIVKVLVGD